MMTVLSFLVMTVGMATAPVIIAVVAAVIAVTGAAIIGIAFIAHVIAQCAASTAACGRTDQSPRAAAHSTAQHVTAGGAQGTANGCFATAALVGTHCAACCAAYASTNG
jgi:hypothetical protein